MNNQMGKRATDEYNLAVLYPDLASEWHPKKNGTLKPYDVTPGSSRKVWWKCNNGHEWEAIIASRKNGSSCPACSYKKRGKVIQKTALRKRGSLADKYPEIANEWHPTKNGDLSPNDVTSRTSRKVWWICSEGHEWSTAIAHRTGGSGCPYCWGRYPTEENNLLAKYPDIAKEWHPTKNGDLAPDQVTPGSGKKVWWICTQGHEWITTVSHRTGQGSGCPYCAGKYPTEENNLLAKYPQIAKEWHPTKNGELTPYQVTPGSQKKIWWKCSEGHEWNTRVATRTRGRGCPQCSKLQRVETYKKSVLKRSGSFAEKYPEIALEWHPTKNGEMTPYQLSPGSHEKVWWRCNRGHEWEATILNRVYGTGCPYCNPRTSRLEIRIYCELKTIFSDVKWRERIDKIECDVYIPKYKFGVEIDGYPWHDGYEERDKQKSKQLLEKGVKVFRVRNKKLSQIAQTDIFYCETESHVSIINRMLKNLISYISFTSEDTSRILDYFKSNRLQNRREYGDIIALLPSPPPEKSLAQLYPRLAKEWNYEKNSPLDPNMFTPGSGKKVWWRCSQGHEWEATVNSRTTGNNCPICRNEKRGEVYIKAMLKIRGSLATKYPNIAKEWHPTKNGDLAPDQVTPGSGKKVWWRCSKGHEWEAKVNNRTNGTGCPECYEQRRIETYLKAVLKRSGSLADKYPNVAKEWHPTKNRDLTPYHVTPGSKRKVWWRCNRGHEWEAQVKNRTYGSGCPICRMKR